MIARKRSEITSLEMLVLVPLVGLGSHLRSRISNHRKIKIFPTFPARRYGRHVQSFDQDKGNENRGT